MPLFRKPATVKGLLVFHVLAYNGARLLLVCATAGIVLAIRAAADLAIPLPAVLFIALAASLPFSAFAFRKLRRTINADIDAVDRMRAEALKSPASRPSARCSSRRGNQSHVK
ncbi:DUF4229 domain-containing protein [Rhodococcus sp. BP-252]|uniref:DUF4229 domain-containing protein n=1 Tax=Rhodococcoides kyotonense TaxID=398843 RepID=A0A177YMJ9_9NOCA|nr:MULTISPECIES: DUF4229 domain-containing protein [Rhodococcus]MBY6413937.1 DUF4229 domain-containing protein [Rhodococcus sp. BP-320]MBY6418613.1 DUF4229 domain-containing protein [Rhodococcus sp. BP-321]MBY6422908.1 DUF4229 domain-containing protein [Rhodococcus sp. BP-324]MBY6428743.1 DUF4229 domain-containing protein [Rhodococcus sp. BP-323]MBY6433734.1 DUF4229 domain-containing protein [Rhodococcus sp. BP-322]